VFLSLPYRTYIFTNDIDITKNEEPLATQRIISNLYYHTVEVEFDRYSMILTAPCPTNLRWRPIWSVDFYSDNQSQNREVYEMAFIADLAYRGYHGSFLGQAVRSLIPTGTVELRIARISAMWTAISSALIHYPFKTTRLA